MPSVTVQGTGLGLSPIFGFARQSDGQVRVTSAVGQGTTMCVDLVRDDGEEAPPDQRPDAEDSMCR